MNVRFISLQRLASRLALCAILVAALSFILNVLIASHNGIAQPRIHDEFSYLLAADTFAHGRLTNPTHPLWRFFQTFHVLQRPTYMSKYPPGQGLMLAIGKIVADEPIVGVWMGSAILCAAALWMLNGFLPRTWSLAGAILLAVHPLLANWSQTYWGGTLAAIGGAAVLGAWARLTVKPRMTDGAILGIGLVILAGTRPYEGMAFALPIIISLLIRPRPALLAAAAMTLLGAVWIGYYNYRITNHPLELPYFVYERQYAVAPPFLWQSFRPIPSLDVPEMLEYATQIEMPHSLAQRSVSGFARIAGEKLSDLIRAAVSPWIIGLSILFLPMALRLQRRLWMPLAATGAVLAATLMSNWTRPQYVAAAAPAGLLLVMAGFCWMAQRAPTAAASVTFAAIVWGIFLSFATTAPASEHFQRGEIQAQLSGIDGQHLVLVNYLPGHRLDDEYVYNDADIDGSKIVWAHDMGEKDDRSLLDYFKDRTIWRLDVDSNSARIQRYTPPHEFNSAHSHGG